MTDFAKSFSGKNAEIKREILGICFEEDFSIAEISRRLSTSIPTVTKIVSELIEDGFLMDMGKQSGNGGRKPSVFGLAPGAGYLVGVDTGRDHLAIAITDFKGNIVHYEDYIPFCLRNTKESFHELVSVVKTTIADAGIDMGNVITCGINLSGRVNSFSGYSFTYFISEERSLRDLLEQDLGVPVSIENDSRAMAYGEYMLGVVDGEKDVLFLNLGWGLGMGMILDGRLNFGKSGFSGELGHIPIFDNDIICHCGKVGCLETGLSGSALHRMVVEKLQEGRKSNLSEAYEKNGDVSLDEILEAARDEDVLSIELIEQTGALLGKVIAGLINIFNPELVVVGGLLSEARDYLMLSVRGSVNKYSLNLVSKDTMIKVSRLGTKAGPLGACMLARSRMLGLL